MSEQRSSEPDATPMTPCWLCGADGDEGIFYCPEHRPLAPPTGQAISEAEADKQRYLAVHDRHVIDGMKRMLERVRLEGSGPNASADERRGWSLAMSVAMNALSRGEWRDPQ